MNKDVNYTPTQHEYTKLTPFRGWVLNNFPFIAEDFDALTYYEMLCKIVGELNKVIGNQNLVEDDMTNLFNAYNQLQEYVNNYFTDLNIQNQVNNKLDEMAKSGELDEIITSYVNLKGLIVYNTVEDLEESTNLVNGSIARTLGFYEINDQGGALYKIRTKLDTDVIDNMSIIEIMNSNLVAVYQIEKGNINPKQFGAHGNNTNDDSTSINASITYANKNNIKVLFSPGTYLLNSIMILNSDITIEGDNTTLNFQNLAENVSFRNGSKNKFKNIKVINNQGIALNLNSPDIKDVLIEGNDLDSQGYGILINYNTDGNENIIINKNKVVATADAIEINTTSTNDNKAKNIIITDNILSVPRGSGTTAGFGVGIATGKNINVSNNIITNCRNEAVHIEDGSESIIVTNNNLVECNGSGVILYNTDTKGNATHIITNNYIKANPNSVVAGIVLQYASFGYLKDINLSNNIIDGFAVGLNSNNGNTFINANNLKIANCGVALSGQFKNITGNLQLYNTPQVYVCNANTIINIDHISSFNQLADNFIVNNSSTGIVILRRLSSVARFTNDVVNNYHQIRLFKLPKELDTDISVIINSNQNSADSIKTTAHITLSEGAITTTNRFVKASGSIADPQFLATSDGYLAIQVYYANLQVGRILTSTFDIDGNMVFAPGYNMAQ